MSTATAEQVTVKAVNKAGTGIIPEGSENWVNTPRGGEAVFLGVKKGDILSLDKDHDGYVVGIKKTGSAPVAFKKPFTPSAPKEVLPANARQTAVNAVMGSSLVKDDSLDIMENYDTAKQFMKDIEAYILTGKFLGDK